MQKDNYTPITILSFFSKVFGTVITDQLMEYFKSILIICFVHIERNMV